MENRIIKKRPLLTRSRSYRFSRLVRKTKKSESRRVSGGLALVLGLEGHDGKRLAKRCQHLQDRIKLRVGVSALHSGDLGLFNAAQGFKLTLTDALFLPCFNQLRDERNAAYCFPRFLPA